MAQVVRVNQTTMATVTNGGLFHVVTFDLGEYIGETVRISKNAKNVQGKGRRAICREAMRKLRGEA